MGFASKKISHLDSYNNFFDRSYIGNKKKFFIKTTVILISFIILYFYRTVMVSGAQHLFRYFGYGVINVVSNTLGTDMKTDDLKQINVLIIGVGGSSHQGGFLADSIMLASYNPKIGAVTFLSVPRDLYVKKPNKDYGKLNGVFTSAFGFNRSTDEGALALSKKVSEITNVPIDYYALIDFNGFITLIDKLGGLEIYVRENLRDSSYPDGKNGYMVFSVNSGRQTMDGSTALKYARSRHSTSDFSRSLRQQDIIKAIINRLLTTKNLTNPSVIGDLYETFKEIVVTNISIKEIIGLMKYLPQERDFFSFQYTANCGFNDHKLMEAGCALYYPRMDLFGGASVLLADGATPNKVEYFKHTQDFAFIVIYNQGMLLEKANIRVLNGIDKQIAKKKLGSSSTFATKVAVKLKKYGFIIDDVDNSDTVYEKTTLFINNTGKHYTNTLKLLPMFIDIAEIKTGSTTGNDDITIVLGNDFADNPANKNYRYDLGK